MAMNPLRRKLAIASWDAPSEGNIYGKLTVDGEEAAAFVDHVRTVHGARVTLTHLVGKAVAEALARSPGLNGTIRFGKYVPHDTVDISFLVALDDGSDLAKARIDRVDQKTLPEMADELRERATRLRSGSDAEFRASQDLVRRLPSWLLKPMVRFVGWLTGSLGVAMPALGLTRFPFGSCVITNVGVFGLDEGYVPAVPFAHVPLYVLVGALKARPAVVDGKVAIRRQLTLTATIDHRFLDGAHGAELAKVVRSRLENPWPLIGLDRRPVAA